MRFITTRTHGVLDYLMGLFLLISPMIFDLPLGSVPANVLQIMGGTMIIASLCTNYELGLVRMIPMKVHLTTDVLVGLFIALSPWLFGFEDQLVMPHVVLGLLEIGAGLMTHTIPQFRPSHAEQPHAGQGVH